MTPNRRFAITGGIGSGKSAVLRILRSRGYPVFSCDEIYAELCTEKTFLDALSKRFPGCVKNGELDRPALSHIVFSDTNARSQLNAFTHPRIMEELFIRMAGFSCSFAEVPLLFEEGYADSFDGVIVVLRNKAARIAAIKSRSSLDEEQILARMDSQFDYAKLPQGCMILENNGSLGELEEKLHCCLVELGV